MALVPADNSSRTTDEARPPQRGELRGEHQAIVVVERRFLREGDPRREEMPPGWKWVLGNSRVSDLYDRLFAEAQLTWSSLVVPEETRTRFSDLETLTSSRQPIQAFDGRLQIRSDALTQKPSDGEPLYLIFNGHRFPICDLSHAMQVHRQNRCDVTLLDFPATHRRRGYEEKLRVDSAGRVQGIDRSYGRSTAPARDVRASQDWPALLIMGAEAMKQLLDAALPHRMNQWPNAMLAAGLRLRGSTIPGRCFNLHDREHLYELNELILRLRPQWICESGGLREQSPKVWVGRGVKVAEGAELIGPLAIGDDVEIGANAVLVGPTTIGRGSRIGAGVIIKRSVVLPHTAIVQASLETPLLSRAIVLGREGEGGVEVQPARRSEEGESGGDPRDHSAVYVDFPIRLQTVVQSGGGALISRLTHALALAAKRGIDIVGALILLALSLPFYPIIMTAIYLSSPGPVFFGHLRQGRGGREFRCWKFRTMIRNAEEVKRKLAQKNEVDGPQFKIKDDPRIFPFGKFLRKCNLDELPQAWNVLVGQMSLVGPRPSPDKENQMCPAWREARLSVRPGITGLWQVSRQRDRGETDFQEWIYYDVQYVKKWSLWLDIVIIFKTFRVILGGR